MRARTSAWAGLVLALAVAQLLSAPAASAHGSAPVQATPAPQQQLEQWPAEVRLEFGQALQTLPATVSVTSPSGKQMVSAPAVASETVLSAPLRAPDEEGIYTVAYSILFVDGAPLRGSYEFTLPRLAAPVPPSPSSAPVAADPVGADPAVAGPDPSAEPWRIPFALAAVGLLAVAMGGAWWPRPSSPSLKSKTAAP